MSGLIWPLITIIISQSADGSKDFVEPADFIQFGDIRHLADDFGRHVNQPHEYGGDVNRQQSITNSSLTNGTDTMEEQEVEFDSEYSGKKPVSKVQLIVFVSLFAFTSVVSSYILITKKNMDDVIINEPDHFSLMPKSNRLPTVQGINIDAALAAAESKVDSVVNEMKVDADQKSPAASEEVSLEIDEPNNETEKLEEDN